MLITSKTELLIKSLAQDKKNDLNVNLIDEFH